MSNKQWVTIEWDSYNGEEFPVRVLLKYNSAGYLFIRRVKARLPDGFGSAFYVERLILSKKLLTKKEVKEINAQLKLEAAEEVE